MTNWTEERCSSQPSELEIIGNELYIQRRDVEETDEGWICESRQITFSEMNLLREIEAIDVAKAIEDYTMELIEEGIL